MTTAQDLSFMVYDTNGNPLEGASYTWVGGAPIDVATGLPTADPGISDKGHGKYTIPLSTTIHVAGVLDFGPSVDIQFRWQRYDSPTTQNNDLVFLIRNPDFSPLTGQTGIWYTPPFDQVTGLPTTVPTVRELSSGLYAVPSVAVLGQHVIGTLDFGFTAQSRFEDYDSYIDQQLLVENSDFGEIQENSVATLIPSIVFGITASVLEMSLSQLSAYALIPGPRALVFETADATLSNEVRVHFTGYGTPGAFTGTLTPAELRMETPFPYPALEAIRRRTLTAIALTSDFPMQARTITILAYSTDVRGVFSGIFTIAASELAVARYGRRRLLEISGDLGIVYSWIPQAFNELRQIGVPEAYLNLLLPRLNSTSFTDRVSAMCAIVLLTAILVR